MRYFKYGFLIIIFAVPVGLVTAVLMAVQDYPLVSSRVQLSHQDVDRAKKLLKQHDPRKLNKGEIRTLAVSESDLNRAGNYVLSRIGRARFKLILDPGIMLVQGTLRLPKPSRALYQHQDPAVRNRILAQSRTGTSWFLVYSRLAR